MSSIHSFLFIFFLVHFLLVFLVPFISEEEPWCVPLWLEDGTKRGASIHHMGVEKGLMVTLAHHYQKLTQSFT